MVESSTGQFYLIFIFDNILKANSKGNSETIHYANKLTF